MRHPDPKNNLPIFAHKNARIGILGGSFNPPHPGHIHAANLAIRALNLDKLWFVPSHGNPLKTDAPAPLATRIHKLGQLAQHPKMHILDLETIFQSRFTIDIIQGLQRYHPQTQFFLIFGTDILAEFHRWRAWENLAHRCPILFITRPGFTLTPLSSPFALKYKHYRHQSTQMRLDRNLNLPAWGILQGPLLDISSTKLRALEKRAPR